MLEDGWPNLNAGRSYKYVRTDSRREETVVKVTMAAFQWDKYLSKIRGPSTHQWRIPSIFAYGLFMWSNIWILCLSRAILLLSYRGWCVRTACDTRHVFSHRCDLLRVRTPSHTRFVDFVYFVTKALSSHGSLLSYIKRIEKPERQVRILSTYSRAPNPSSASKMTEGSFWMFRIRGDGTPNTVRVLKMRDVLANHHSFIESTKQHRESSKTILDKIASTPKPHSEPYV